jgi:phage gpG-like protein
MTPAEFQKLFESRLKDLKKYASQDLPRHMGKIAVDAFRDNFHQGGYQDDEFTAWKPSKRIGQGKSAAAAYGTLLSSRVELYNSIRYSIAGNKVIVSSGKPYSRIHNEGGTINQTIQVTPKMRKFAWAKYYEANGGEPGDSGREWKGLALTKKQAINRTFTMPKRQFMGPSAHVKKLIYDRMVKDFKRILFN